MSIEKKHWITNGAELVQSGDLVRLRGDDGEWSEWGPADHLAGSRVDSFVQWHGMGVQFARVPTATDAAKPSDGSEWLTDPTEIIQRGDLFRVRDDSRSEYGAWLPADHLAGTAVSYFPDWQRRNIQFCRPARPAPEPQWEMVSDRDYILRPGVDQVRCRTYLNESEHWSEWTNWHTIEAVRTIGGFVDGLRRRCAADEWQFRRRVADAKPASEPEWEPLPIEEDTMTVPGRDQARYRRHGDEWSDWLDTHGDPALLTAFMQQKPPEFEWEWRRRKVAKAKLQAEQTSAQDWMPVIDPNHVLRAQRDQVRTKEAGQWSAWRHPPFGEGLTIAQYFTGPGEWECRTPRGLVSQQPQRPAPKQPPTPTTDRGSKYHRTITQTLPGDTRGLSLTVDVYDVCRAFGVTCPATQHAVKKLLCPGLRGAKSAEQDIEEAANSCRRAIELLEFDL